jgi:hypothetical protein
VSYAAGVRFVVMLALAALVSSCRSSAVEHPAPDLAAPAGLACAGIEGCVSACSGAAADCAARCAARLTAGARPYYEALQACVAPACADGGDRPCLQPSTFACKLCVMSHCAAAAAACVAH